jgi:ribosomal protein S18 acetylase RimI-like enzyme
MTKVKYRLLHSTDMDSYKRIRLECLANYPDHFGDSYEEEVNNATPKFDKALMSNDNNTFLYGAFSENTLIGICGFIQQERIKTRHRGDLVQVYVNPSFSGQGIGRELIKLTIAKAFDNILIDQILLSVVYTNDKAVKLYKKLGFVQYGIIENYFKQNDNSWSQLFMALTRKNYLAEISSRENRNAVRRSVASANGE